MVVESSRNMRLAATERGNITKSKFHKYGLHFMKFLKAHGLTDKSNLLIIDGHKRHLYNLPFYEAMRANNIKIIFVEPYLWSQFPDSHVCCHHSHPRRAVWASSSCPSSDMTLIFLQVEDDVESYQMLKWSRRDDLAKVMIEGLGDTAKAKAKPKSSNTAAAASKGKGKGK